MLELLLSKDWTANRDEIMRRIANDVLAKRPGRILVVPELISHDTERRLCTAAGDTASRYAEVLSFTRLGRRVSEFMGCPMEECLDNGGRVVAMAAAARQLTSRLKAYAAVETKPEFLSGLVECVDEFKRCCITAKDLSVAAHGAEGSLAQKLEELAILMEGYDSICAQGKRDPRDQMMWVLEQMELGEFAQNHTVYVDGFPDFTRQHFAVLEHLIRYAPSVTVSLTCDSPYSNFLAFEKSAQTARDFIKCAQRAGVEVKITVVDGAQNSLSIVRDKLFQGSYSYGVAASCVHTYRATDIWQECIAAAEQVSTIIRNGGRYRDVTLVCADLPAYKGIVDLVFRRMNIPLYQSGTEDILKKSVISTLLSALDVVVGGFDQKDVVKYLRSALSVLDLDDCDAIENYAIIWGIRGKQWLKNWENHPEGLSKQWDDISRAAIEKLNNLRQRSIDPLKHLYDGFRAATSLAQQVEALYAFMEETCLEEKLCKLAEQLEQSGENREAQILNQLWEIIISALEQMYDVLGNTHWDGEHFVRLLRLLLSQYDVGTIPPVLDAVQMGPVSAMRCHEQKHLIVLGAQQGNLPGYSGSRGILTDQERVALRKLGVPLTGGAMEGIQAEFAEIYGVFCGAKESIHVYCSATQPSFVFCRLSDMAGGDTSVPVYSGFTGTGLWEVGAWLAKWDAGDAAISEEVKEIYKAVCKQRDYSIGNIQKEQILGLYGNTLNLSASQIDRQAECRMSYFLKYGLRVQELKEAEIDPAEFGTYVHYVLEKTAKKILAQGGFKCVSLEDALEIAHQFSNQYAEEHFSQITSERVTYLFRRNIHELDMVVGELWSELQDSSFQPKDFEVNFGNSGDMPPIEIPNSKMHAVLRGFIDRVDVWTNGSTDYYRVVDYKTGKKDFDYCDVFNGVGLQMLLYMFALKQNEAAFLGKNPIPAGVQYFPARSPYLPTDGSISDEDLEKERTKQWKRKGILLKDDTVLQAMEPGESPQRMNYSIKKDGTLTGDLADRDQLKLLEKYTFHVVGKMVEDIASGNIEANPYTRGTSHDACAFCPYGSICHKTSVSQRRNYKAMSPQRFWEELEKEMTSSGR